MPSAEQKLAAVIPRTQESLCVSCSANFNNSGNEATFGIKDFAQVAISEQAAQAVKDGRLALSMKEEDQLARSIGGAGRDGADPERIGLIARCLIRRVNGGCNV